MKKNKFRQPRAFVEPSKDHRHPNTFAVHVPVPDRVKPHIVAHQFETQKAAEDWIHSPEGEEAIDELLAKHKK